MRFNPTAKYISTGHFSYEPLHNSKPTSFVPCVGSCVSLVSHPIDPLHVSLLPDLFLCRRCRWIPCLLLLLLLLHKNSQNQNQKIKHEYFTYHKIGRLHTFLHTFFRRLQNRTQWHRGVWNIVIKHPFSCSWVPTTLVPKILHQCRLWRLDDRRRTLDNRRRRKEKHRTLTALFNKAAQNKQYNPNDFQSSRSERRKIWLRSNGATIGPITLSVPEGCGSSTSIYIGAKTSIASRISVRLFVYWD